MSYKSLVQQFTQDGYMKKLAGSIKLKMSEQRQGANPDSERRWIWELIQNGKDVRYSDTPFNIMVELKTDQSPAILEFKHNGKPFSVKNITYLVEQVSSKDQEFEEDGLPTNTGKFGSGFLTTHLLSEKVKIDTIIKADGLNYKRCLVELDRSPRQEPGIMQSIKDSLSVLENLDAAEDLTKFDQNAFNTTFIYELDAHGTEIAKAGLKDLNDAIPLVLCFVQGIANVNVASDGIDFKLRHDLTSNDENIYHYTIEKSDFLDDEKIEILVAKGIKVCIAIPVKGKGESLEILPISTQTARLYCDFPLIGTESFPFPAIINSPLFNLNDPRSIVRLTDNTEPEITENKDLVVEASKLFLQLLRYLEKNKARHNFNLTKNITDVNLDWISADWYKSKILDPIHLALSRTIIVDTQGKGRRSVLNEKSEATVYFPFSGKADIREDIFNLAVEWFPNALPRKEEIHEWATSLFPGCSKLTLKTLSKFIEYSKDIKNLGKQFKDNVDPVDWLNRYYFLLNKEENYIKDVAANEIKVLPDQNGDFKEMKELQFDPGLDEIIKDCFFQLGRDIRSELRMAGINTAKNIKENAKHKIGHVQMKIEDAFGSLNTLIKEADEPTAFDVAIKLVQVFGTDNNAPAYRNELFNAVQRIYPDSQLTKQHISKYDSRIYEQSDQVLMYRMVCDISASQNIETFAFNHSFTNKVEALSWLTGFVDLLIKMNKGELLQLTDYPILPNQNGEFRIKDALSFGDTDETLKNVSVKLGHDFRALLIETNIPIEFDTSREITNKDIAEKISALIGGLMSDLQNDSETKETFQLLFNWFNANGPLAESLFGELYHNRHRLCSPDEIVSSLEKAATLDAIMKEHGLETIDDLRQLLDQERNDNSDPLLTEVTQDILLSLGVSNYEEFKKALGDKNLAELFGHESVPSSEYFMFVQAIIERTRTRIKTFLEGIGYDFREAELTATTVYSGVIKDGDPIDIVFRPSDNNEVIFYYGSEKQTLENPASELWVADATSVPEQITLGRILIANRIIKVRIH